MDSSCRSSKSGSGVLSERPSPRGEYGNIMMDRKSGTAEACSARTRNSLILFSGSFGTPTGPPILAPGTSLRIVRYPNCQTFMKS